MEQPTERDEATIGEAISDAPASPVLPAAITSHPSSSTDGAPVALADRRKGIPSPLVIHRKLTFLDADPKLRAAKKIVKRRASIFGGMLGTWKTKGTVKKAGNPNSLDRGEVQRLMKRSSVAHLPPVLGNVSYDTGGIIDDLSYSTLTGWSPAPNSTTFPQMPLVLPETGLSDPDTNPFTTPPRTPLSPRSENMGTPESPTSLDSFLDSPRSQKAHRRSMGSGLKTLQILGSEAKDAVAAKYNLAL